MPAKTIIILLLGLCFTGCKPPAVDYQAKDYDPGLTKRARTALPIIAALTAYQHDKGSFPGHVSDLAPYLHLPSDVVLAEETIDPGDAVNHGGGIQWAYRPIFPPPGYQLSVSLDTTMDPTLLYEFDGKKGAWIFDPGNGDPVKNILLSL